MSKLSLLRGMDVVTYLRSDPHAKKLYQDWLVTLAGTDNLRLHYPPFHSFEHFVDMFLATPLHPYERLAHDLKGEDKEFVLIVGTDPAIMLPLLAFKSPDRGYMASHWLDLGAPYIHQYLYEVLPADFALDFDGQTNLVWVPEGRGDYVLRLYDNFEVFRKEHSQVSRCWSKRPPNLTYQQIEEGDSLCRNQIDPVELENIEYHLKLAFDLDWVELSMAGSNLVTAVSKDGARNAYANERALMYQGERGQPTAHLARNVAVFRTSVGSDVIGYTYLAYDHAEREVFWLNTIRRRNEEGIPEALKGLPMGNLILLQTINHLYETGFTGWRFNMGIDLFDYKKNWKPEHHWCPGFGFAPKL